MPSLLTVLLLLQPMPSLPTALHLLPLLLLPSNSRYGTKRAPLVRGFFFANRISI